VLDQGVVHAAAHSTGVGLVLLGVEILLGALAYVGAATVLSRSAVVEFAAILRHLVTRVGPASANAAATASPTEARRAS
jgi:hypothetical protein